VNNFWRRTFTSIIFTGTLLGCIFYGPYSFFILFSLIALLTLREFYVIIANHGIQPQQVTGLGIAVVMLLTVILYLIGIVRPAVLFINVPLLFIVLIYELYTKSEKPFHNIAFTIFGVVYIVVPFTLLMAIPYLTSAATYQWHLVFGYFLLVWASDTGAYLTGMAFGKRKLFERISPKKSWEGSIGGMLLNLFLAWCCSKWFPDLDHLTWTITGLLIVITGTFGDLAESLLKRTLNIKDSGNLLPGHGGLLDRFDALLVSVPFVVAFLALVR